MFHGLLTIKCMLACFVNLTDIYELYVSPTLKGNGLLGGEGNCPGEYVKGEMSYTRYNDDDSIEYIGTL